MRKYQQLLLVLVSFVSVTSLLLYRYEYMQLLNVLEVLNFFGYTADNMTKCILLEDKFYVDMENDNLLAKAPVSWIKRDQYYAYSAFWSAQQQSVHLQILGPSTAFSGYECRVWFKIADQFVSRTAKLSYNIKTNNGDPNFHQYEIHCKPDVPVDTEPYGVLLGRDNSLKLFIPITVQKESPIKDDLIVCIAPDYSGIPDTYLVEFIAYYTLLGVRHFVVYDIGIHYQVIEFLRSIAGHKDLYKTFSTLSWQFPSTDLHLEKSILQKDCLQRTQGLAKHSILLSWDLYLMLNKNEGLNSLKNDIEYTFEVKKCCNNRQLKKSLPMAMKKTICERTNETVNTIINDQTINYQSPTKMGSIHRLEEVCEKIYGEDDKSMVAKYLINFVHSKLLSLWKSQLKLSITRAKNNNVINL